MAQDDGSNSNRNIFDDGKILEILHHQMLRDYFGMFRDKSFHPSQCISWLLKNLDFDAKEREGRNFNIESRNFNTLRQAFLAHKNYLSQCQKEGLTYDEHEEALSGRLKVLKEVSLMKVLKEMEGTTTQELDWKAVKRVLEGSYDDQIARGKIPYALTKGIQ